LLYQSDITSLFNFPFSGSQGNIINCVRSGDGMKLAESIVRWQTQLNEVSEFAIDALFLSNHDNARSAGMLMRDTVLQKMATSVYLLLPGNPFIYYGEEIAMLGGSDNDPNKRAPLVWSKIDVQGIPNPPTGTTTVQEVAAAIDEQLKDKDSLLRFYISAIRLKNNYPALARGRISAVDVNERTICAYSVGYEGASLCVMHNLGDAAVEVDISQFGYNALLTSLNAGGTAPSLKGHILKLPPFSTAILE